MILIFSNKEDTHPTPVILRLNEMGVPFFRLNTEALLTDYEFSWWAHEKETDFYIKNIINNSELYGHDITAIWDRRPVPPTTTSCVNDETVSRYCLDEAHGFLSFLRYYLRDIYSIGSIVFDRPAGSKMLQLSVARELGFRIPHTLFSNRKQPFIRHFSGTKNITLKPIDTDSLYLNEEEYVFYASKKSFNDVSSQKDAAFESTAYFSQEYIEKLYELRITVCCGDVVACKIDSQKQKEGEGKEDWRQGYDYGLKYELVNLPDKVKSFCTIFLKRMGLNFGCFDFIVTPENDYVFLECNPNGQWYWIELETGADISGMIARHLANPSIL